MKPNSFWKQSIQNNSRLSYLENLVKNNSVIDFSSGENVLLESKIIIDVLKKIKTTDLHKAPEINCGDIKKKISEVLAITSEMITIGNGSDEIIENIPRVFIEPNDQVFTIIPTFFRFINSSKKMNGKIITVATTHNESFKFTDRVIGEAISIIKKQQPKLTWLCSPNNPTGEVMKFNQIEKIIQVSKNLVIVDEAFQELIDPDNKRSSINLIKKYKNLLVLKTFSKTWGLGGIRFGFAVGSESTVDILEKWRLPFNVNAITRNIILKLLDRWGNLKVISQDLEERRKRLFTEINKMNHLEIGADSKINIFILRHKSKDLFQELLKRKILTADFREASGLEGKGFVRITIKNRKENEILLKTLREIN